jgi:hypothetical protein
MAELKRKDEQLTTADLAGRTEAQNRAAQEAGEAVDPDRPKPVRSEMADVRDKAKMTTPNPAPHPHGGNISTPLFSESDISDLRSRWGNVQAGFVDEPRRAVEEADKLVAAVMKRLAEGFAGERSTLEKQWDRGDNVSTEDLRVALQRYRSFFDRLLNA